MFQKMLSTQISTNTKTVAKSGTEETEISAVLLALERWKFPAVNASYLQYQHSLNV
jgi:hypothetical protein